MKGKHGNMPDTTTPSLLDHILEFSEYMSANCDVHSVFLKGWQIIRSVTDFEYALVMELAKSGQLCLKVDAMGTVHRCGVNGSSENQASAIMDLVIRGVVDFDKNDREVHGLVTDILDFPGVSSGISVAIPGAKRPLGIIVFCSRSMRGISEEARSLIRILVNQFGVLMERVSASREQQLEIQHALQAKREWESTIDALREIICLLDRDGRVIRANRAIEEWGLGKVAEVRGMTVHELLHPDCRNSPCDLKNSLEIVTGQVAETQAWFLDDAQLGKELKFLYKNNRSDTRFSDSTNSLTGVLIIENVTHRKNTQKSMMTRIDALEKEVVEAKSSIIHENTRLLLDLVTVFENDQSVMDTLSAGGQFWNFLLDNSLAGLFITKNGYIVYANHRFAAQLDRHREELLGKQLSELMEFHESRRVSPGVVPVVYPPESSSGIYRVVTPVGTILWLQCDVTDIEVEDDDISVGSVIDTTGQHVMEMDMRRSQQNLHTLTRRLLYAQEDERRRIATELHDSIGQHLSAVKMNIETAMRMIHNKGLQDEGDFLNSSVTNIRSAIDEVRSIAMDLRPSILDDLGLLVTIDWFCRRFRETYRQTTVHFEKGIEEQAIPEVLKVTIYRVVQEALNNIGKHAQADTIWIALKRMEAGIKLTIRDNGAGFDVYQHRPGSDAAGLGLKSMRERAEIFGGTFWLDSQPGEGTTIELSWPDQRYS